MKNPTFDRKHLLEYLLYGFIGAFLYTIPLFFYLKSNRYENSYYLYIGNALFFLAVFFYNVRLLYRPYDKRRAVSMLMAGHLVTLAGIILSVVCCLVMMLLFYKGLFAARPVDTLLANAPANSEMHHPSDWLFMIFINAIICNFGAGSLISVLVSYAGKKNQTKDKPAHLEMEIPVHREEKL